ncbi:peptidase S8 [Chloroflexus islandicus]|uniref:Peptidase S8 n=1 Tax=Chloroflexus islandicus TaxID=1707952 RepID=A0A178MEP6_9CHLR|nr:S8 family serine peptidase [Chloroflexus islandicus]OAN47231.1 peptidase S8 [Chloroflexus islandicus]
MASFDQTAPRTGRSWGIGCLLAAVLLIALGIGAFLRLVEIGVSLFGAGGIGRVVVIWISLIGGAVAFAIWAGVGRGAVRAAALRWLAALPLPAMLAFTALIPSAESQWIALAQLGVSVLYALAVTLFVRRPVQWGWTPVAVSTGLLAGLPWLAIGAPGSWLDVAVALLQGAVVGWAGGQLLAWQPPQSWQSASVPTGVWLAEGAALGLLLLILSRALGPNSAPLLFLFAAPAGGWLWLALGRQAGLNAAAPLSASFGLFYFGLPLAFTDPDALVTLLLFSSFPEGFHLALLAAIGQALLALLVTPLALFVTDRRVHAAGAGLAAVAGLALLIGGGRAAPAGDRVFVVLREQADVSALATIADYDQRRVAVYRRLTAHAATTQADLRVALDQLGVRYTPFYLVNALEVEADLPLRLWLQSRPEVAVVMPAPHLRPLPFSPLPATGDQPPPDEPPWNVTMIGAPEAWALGARGAGIIIGQADSGVELEHPELSDAYAGRTANGVEHAYHWLDPWTGATAPYDLGGHGTHTLATALGNTVGVAPDAQWIGCVNLARNLGNAPRYLDCMQFLFAPYPPAGDPLRDGDPTRGAHVFNNSWGCPQDLEGCAPDALQPAVAALRAAGVFVVASAGNDGPACSSLNAPLAIYDDVLTVGAVDADGQLAPFSSVGPVQSDGSGRVKPDLVAPGVDILSAYPNQSYARADGTSMAGPHVAGAVALLWSANPALIGNITETERILRETARPYTAADGERCGAGNVAGAGILDVAAAVRRAISENR